MIRKYTLWGHWSRGNPAWPWHFHMVLSALYGYWISLTSFWFFISFDKELIFLFHYIKGILSKTENEEKPKWGDTRVKITITHQHFISVIYFSWVTSPLQPLCLFCISYYVSAVLNVFPFVTLTVKNEIRNNSWNDKGSWRYYVYAVKVSRTACAAFQLLCWFKNFFFTWNGRI